MNARARAKTSSGASQPPPGSARTVLAALGVAASLRGGEKNRRPAAVDARAAQGSVPVGRQPPDRAVVAKFKPLLSLSFFFFF